MRLREELRVRARLHGTVDRSQVPVHAAVLSANSATDAGAYAAPDACPVASPYAVSEPAAYRCSHSAPHCGADAASYAIADAPRMRRRHARMRH